MGHVITVDIVETGRVTGWADLPSYGRDFPISGNREGRTWRLFAGTGDEYSAQGSSLDIAVRRLAKKIGLTGTAKIGTDATFSEREITL